MFQVKLLIFRPLTPCLFDLLDSASTYSEVRSWGQGDGARTIPYNLIALDHLLGEIFEHIPRLVHGR